MQRSFILGALLCACGGGAAPDAGTPSRDAALDLDASADAALDASADAQLDAGITPSGLEPNDVSILVPLPSPPQPRASALWLVPQAGEVGPWFPVDQIDMLGPLVADFPDLYGDVMIVGVRFDPCARVDLSDACQAQLRLVGQPVLYDGSSAPMMTDDSAVHLVYVLEEREAADVVAELRAMKELSPVSTAGPLGVHPGLRAQGPSGPLGAALRTLVASHCRRDNFLRVTTNSFAFDNWRFARHEWTGDALERATLGHLAVPSDEQSWLRMGGRDDLEDPSGTIDPAPAESFAYLVRRETYASPDPSEVARAVAVLSRIENPTVRTNEMVDCVSCHLSSQTRIHAERHGISFAGAPDAYSPAPGIPADVVLVPEMQGNLNATIAFGYHFIRIDLRDDIVPSISRRTAHETAEVLAHLGRR